MQRALRLSLALPVVAVLAACSSTAAPGDGGGDEKDAVAVGGGFLPIEHLGGGEGETPLAPEEVGARAELGGDAGTLLAGELLPLIGDRRDEALLPGGGAASGVGAELVGVVGGAGAELDGLTVGVLGLAPVGSGGQSDGGDEERVVEEGKLEVAALVAASKRGGLLQKRAPKVSTIVQIDNEASEPFTIVEVFTDDRIGVLGAHLGARPAAAAVGTHANVGLVVLGLVLVVVRVPPAHASICSQSFVNCGSVFDVDPMSSTTTPGTARPMIAPVVAIRWSA